MANVSKLTSAEASRRKQQSKRDKQRSGKAKPGPNTGASSVSGNGKPASDIRSKASGIDPYTALIMDPCKAQLTPTPLPGREGSSIFRLPFRVILTVPSTTMGIAAGAPGASFNATSISVVFTPSACAQNGATTFAFYGTGDEGGLVGTTTASHGNLNTDWGFGDPTGLSALDNVSSLIRPVAACAKLEFYTGTNTGSFMAYEGECGDYAKHLDANGQACMYPTITNSQVAQLGWATSITTQGVEACVNYASAAPAFQNFRQLSNTNATNADIGDYDFSGMPLAILGVGGATTGSKYVLSGAVVYEWVPSLSLLVAGDSHRPVVRKQSTLDKVARQLSEYGPMLVGVASKFAMGGPSLALEDLLYRLSKNVNYGGSTSTQAIGWK